jgi:hypothetical protein
LSTYGKHLRKCKICEGYHHGDQCTLPEWYIVWLSKFPRPAMDLRIMTFLRRYYGPYRDLEEDNRTPAVKKAMRRRIYNGDRSRHCKVVR